MSIQRKLSALLDPLDDALQVALAQRPIEIEPKLSGLDRNVRVEAARRNLVEHLQVVLRDLLGFRRRRQVLAELSQDGRDAMRRDNSRAARSASSIRSPGMNRDTDRRTNPYRVAWSRSQAFVDPASSVFRIKLIE